MTMSMTDMESRIHALEEEVADLRQQLEQSQIVAAMRRSKEQFERGEGVPAVETVKAIARKYGINK